MQDTNGAMMQAFHWYTPADGSLWRRIEEESRALARAGITSLWLPPACKGAAGPNDTGYGTYDLFDLGEFDQKGSVRTKYGTRDEYLRAIRAAQAAGLKVYADIVLNHKMGADFTEECRATPYNPLNRHEALGGLQTISTWTHFTFPGRMGLYSELQWHWWHFNAVDVNTNANDIQAVYLLEGKQFHDDVDLEHGNFDYLMGCDLDLGSPHVLTELLHWGRWYLDTTGVDGFRFDAVKHIDARVLVEWLNQMRAHSGRDLFAVGEYWSGIKAALKHFIAVTEGHMRLFDVMLHYRFAAAGREGAGFDLRTVFDGSLVQSHPEIAVTLVSNHDTQPLQALESVVEPWFKPLAYALILLRQGGYPCIFAADYFGAAYRDIGRDGREHDVRMASHRWLINHFLRARRTQAFGAQTDFFDDPHCIGWTRSGDEEHPGGMAVLLSNEGDRTKAMQTGAPDTTYTDLTRHISEPVTTNGDGWGDFRCRGRSVSVWLPRGRRKRTPRKSAHALGE